jgi:transcriptional regulator with XRE-family HTH domain
MSTKAKISDASKFLSNLAGELTLAKSISSIRIGEEMTQVEFAKLLKISRQYLCDIEHGRRFISPKTAVAFAKKLGYSPHQFVRLCLQDLVNRNGLKLRIDVQDAA